MPEFNIEEARKFLYERDLKKKEKLENERKFLLETVKSILIEEFQNSKVSVFLVGSIIRPYSFSSSSDIDIVLKNFDGNYFALFAKLEEKIKKNIDLIIFEECHFQDFIIKFGLKII